MDTDRSHWRNFGSYGIPILQNAVANYVRREISNYQDIYNTCRIKESFLKPQPPQLDKWDLQALLKVCYSKVKNAYAIQEGLRNPWAHLQYEKFRGDAEWELAKKFCEDLNENSYANELTQVKKDTGRVKGLVSGKIAQYDEKVASVLVEEIGALNLADFGKLTVRSQSRSSETVPDLQSVPLRESHFDNMIKVDLMMNGNSVPIVLDATNVDLIIKIQNLGEQDLYLRAIYKGVGEPDVFIPNEVDKANYETLVPIKRGETKEEKLEITNEEEWQTFTFIIVWQSDKGLVGEYKQFSFFLQKE